MRRLWFARTSKCGDSNGYVPPLQRSGAIASLCAEKSELRRWKERRRRSERRKKKNHEKCVRVCVHGLKLVSEEHHHLPKFFLFKPSRAHSRSNTKTISQPPKIYLNIRSVSRSFRLPSFSVRKLARHYLLVSYLNLCCCSASSRYICVECERLKLV